MVFQNYAVFPHMTVFENIAFGLRMKKRPEEEVRQQGRVGGRADAHREPAREVFRPALRRPAPAGGGGPRARGRAAGAADGRAALQPRRAAAPADARRAQGPPAGEPDHDDLRHPRPGRGDEPRRPDRHHAGRRDRPVRHADERLPGPGDDLLRRLHRQPADELPRPGRAPRRRRLWPARRRRDPGARRRAAATPARHPAGGPRVVDADPGPGVFAARVRRGRAARAPYAAHAEVDGQTLRVTAPSPICRSGAADRPPCGPSPTACAGSTPRPARRSAA